MMECLTFSLLIGNYFYSLPIIIFRRLCATKVIHVVWEWNDIVGWKADGQVCIVCFVFCFVSDDRCLNVCVQNCRTKALALFLKC